MEEEVCLEDHLAPVLLEAEPPPAVAVCLVAAPPARAEAACLGRAAAAALTTPVGVSSAATIQIRAARHHQEGCLGLVTSSHQAQCLEERRHLEDSQPRPTRTRCLEDRQPIRAKDCLEVHHQDRRPLCLAEPAALVSHLPRGYLEDHPLQEPLPCLEEVAPQLSLHKAPQFSELAAVLAQLRQPLLLSAPPMPLLPPSNTRGHQSLDHPHPQQQ